MNKQFFKESNKRKDKNKLNYKKKPTVLKRKDKKHNKWQIDQHNNKQI